MHLAPRPLGQQSQYGRRRCTGPLDQWLDRMENYAEAKAGWCETAKRGACQLNLLLFFSGLHPQLDRKKHFRSKNAPLVKLQPCAPPKP